MLRRRVWNRSKRESDIRDRVADVGHLRRAGPRHLRAGSWRGTLGSRTDQLRTRPCVRPTYRAAIQDSACEVDDAVARHCGIRGRCRPCPDTWRIRRTAAGNDRTGRIDRGPAARRPRHTGRGRIPGHAGPQAARSGAYRGVRFAGLLLGLAGTAMLAWSPMVSGLAHLDRNRSFPTLVDFDRPTNLHFMQPLGGATIHWTRLPPRFARQAGSTHALRVETTERTWWGLMLREPLPDWRNYQRLAVTIANPSREPLTMELRVNDHAARGRFCCTLCDTFVVPPLSWRTSEVPLASLRSQRRRSNRPCARALADAGPQECRRCTEFYLVGYAWSDHGAGENVVSAPIALLHHQPDGASVADPAPRSGPRRKRRLRSRCARHRISTGCRRCDASRRYDAEASRIRTPDPRNAQTGGPVPLWVLAESSCLRWNWCSDGRSLVNASIFLIVSRQLAAFKSLATLDLGMHDRLVVAHEHHRPGPVRVDLADCPEAERRLRGVDAEMLARDPADRVEHLNAVVGHVRRQKNSWTSPSENACGKRLRVASAVPFPPNEGR